MQNSFNIIASGDIAATVGTLIAGGSGAKPGVNYHGAYAISDATNTCVVTIYHGVAATAGKEIDKFSIPASTSSPQKSHLNYPIACPDGIFIVVTGTGAKANVQYSLGS